MRYLEFKFPILWITLLILSVFACERVCTDDFRMVGVTVLTPEEESVFLDHLTIIEKRTGNEIDLCDFDDSDSCPGGQFMEIPDYGIPSVIFHDGLRKKIKRRSMEILVEGFRDSLSFQQEFVIGDDGCHVFKAAGPDTVYLQPAGIK